MSLTWRDTTAFLAIGFGLVAIVAILGGLPIAIADWRAAAILVIILGLAMFLVLGPRFLPVKGLWGRVSSILHSLAIVLSILAFIINDKVTFLALAFSLVSLWIIATTYHIRINSSHRK